MSSHRDVVDHGTSAWAVNTPAVVLASSGLVVTGHVLGVGWLSESVLGLPAGLWFIGLVTLLCTRTVRSRIALIIETIYSVLGRGGHVEQIADRDEETAGSAHVGWWPQGRVAGVVLDGLTRVLSAAVQLAWMPVWGGELSVAGDLRRRVESWLSSASLPTRPLRIGLCMPEDEANALLMDSAAASGIRVEWYRMARWDDPVGACRRHLFDAAVYHDGECPVRIVTLERPGHTAGIVEWADLVGALTFGTLFPGRVDPAAVVIEGASGSIVRQSAPLLRAFAVAAAALSRSEPRLTLADRVLGRRPTDVMERPGGLSLWKSRRCPAAVAMQELVRRAVEYRQAWPEASSLGVDAASAFFVTAPEMSPVERLEGLRELASSGAMGGKSALRMGATCIAALDDDEAMEWLVRADTMLRDGSVELAGLDHAAFLESELAHGSDDPMSLGRAAAGIGLVCASTDPEQIGFVRDDMLEEMAYAGWLVGRDQDRSVLIRVFMELERAHTQQERGGPSKTRKRAASSGRKHRQHDAA